MAIRVQLKTCSRCGEVKPLDAFYKTSMGKYGVGSKCKNCINEINRQKTNPPTVSPKVCKLCSELKPALEFSLCRRSNDGRYAYCKCCKAAYDKARYDKGRERAGRLKRNFGLTQDDFIAILQLQGGTCAICPATEPSGTGDWHIDHDHACCPGKKSCGKCIRGLLCHYCNHLLGNAKDDINILESAIAYLKERGVRWQPDALNRNSNERS